MTLLPGVFPWRGPIALAGEGPHKQGGGEASGPRPPQQRWPPSRMPAQCPTLHLSTSFFFVQGADHLASPPPPLQT